MSQKEQVLKYLKTNKTITTLECMQELDIVDLQKTIQLLRKEYTITDEWIHKTNKFGKKIKYKKYKLEGI